MHHGTFCDVGGANYVVVNTPFDDYQKQKTVGDDTTDLRNRILVGVLMHLCSNPPRAAPAAELGEGPMPALHEVFADARRPMQLLYTAPAHPNGGSTPSQGRSGNSSKLQCGMRRKGCPVSCERGNGLCPRREREGVIGAAPMLGCQSGRQPPAQRPPSGNDLIPFCSMAWLVWV